jgi:para-aminobenzoate synthetase
MATIKQMMHPIQWYQQQHSYLQTSDPSSNVVPWMKEIATKIYELTSHDKSSEKKPVSHTNQELYFNLNRSKKEYSADIERCHEEIKNGESYELCLTNQLSTNVSFPEASSDQLYRTPFGLYKILRSKNPAPFAAFMNFCNKKLDKADVSQNESFVSICCSSPERFLSVTKYDESPTISLGDERNNLDHGWQFAPPFVSKSDKTAPRLIVESKPIKGTASRIITKDGDPDFHERNLEDKAVAKELQQSIKNRAENLMIVDLLRNDLSRVCEPGSVHVPKLMGIESFATVHQMVSTIRGFVDETYTPIDVAAACFPGGSMTGAPKLRSIDILNKLELGNSRGPYSGCLGYISLNGSMDLNIVIRTAVVTPVGSVGSDEKINNTSWDVNIGAGGAITALSDIDDEFEEMLLKASAIKKSVQQWYDDGQS